MDHLISPLALAHHATGGNYQLAPHLVYLERELMKVLLGDEWDVLVAMAPPRHGKSQFLSRWVMAWLHGVFPGEPSIVTSYADQLARSHSRWVRDRTIDLTSTFGHRGVDPASAAAGEWSMRGFDNSGMKSAGVGGGITGRGGKWLVVDDALKNSEQALSELVLESQWEWFQTTFLTRLEPGGKIMILMTRWSEDDLAGKVLKNAADHGLRVRECRLPALSLGDGDPLGRPVDTALWPDRISTEMLLRRKDAMDGYWWDALYQQIIGTHGKNEFPSSYFYGIFAQDDEWPESMALSATALDPSVGKHSNKGDPSAIVNVGFKDGYIWVDADIKRRPVPEMMLDLLNFNEQVRPTVTGIEGVAFQHVLAESYVALQQETGLYRDEPVLIDNTIAKTIRIRRLGFWLRVHRIKIRNNEGGQILVDQLKKFPNGKHDDGPDAAEMAIRLLLQLSEDLAALYEGPDNERLVM